MSCPHEELEIGTAVNPVEDGTFALALRARCCACEIEFVFLEQMNVTPDARAVQLLLKPSSLGQVPLILPQQN